MFECGMKIIAEINLNDFCHFNAFTKQLTIHKNMLKKYTPEFLNYLNAK